MKAVKTQNIIKYIFQLGLPYGAILIFGAFGPATTMLLTESESSLIGTIFLFCISISMMFTPVKIFNYRYFNNIFITLIILVGSGIIIFPFISIIYKIVIIIMYGFILGLFARIWAFEINEVRDTVDSVKLLTGVMFTSYGLLYICNILFPAIPKKYVTIFPGILLFISIPLYLPITEFKYDKIKISSKPLGNFPNYVLLIIYIIFITAGFTYVGIYPVLMKNQPYERFYNVLPFLISLVFIPVLIKKLGRRSLLYIGVTFLGLSYCVFLFDHNTTVYFMIQTFLQPGWAFLDFFAWILGLEIARIIGKPHYLNKTVGAFLLGTFTGAALYQLLKGLFPIISSVFLLLSIIPLFMVIPLFFYVYQKALIQYPENDPLLFNSLTKREREIASYLSEGKSQKEIMDITNISKNTLKTHSRNIYRKLGVQGKNDLKDVKVRNKSVLF